MEYIVQGKDTIYIDEIAPALIHPKSYMSRKEWNKYWRRVHNFSKAYPYALFIAATIQETDSLFVARNYNKIQRDKYLERIKTELLANFEPIFKNLTLAQGMMMVRLVDRVVGKTPYDIIDQYLGGANAGFWQGFAKLLKGDLKRRYDPTGEDADLEELVAEWEAGKFDELYEYIFSRHRPEIFIPEKFRHPFYENFDEKLREKKEGKKR